MACLGWRCELTFTAACLLPLVCLFVLETAEPSPFDGIQKNLVLQEARVFHESQPDPRKCIRVLVRLLYLFNHGEVLEGREATDIFFAVTKLFQSNDVSPQLVVVWCGVV